MRPTYEETLSYLTGLAPLGEPIEVPIEWIMADLGLRTRANWYVRLNGLINEGCVRRIACGAGMSTGVLMVTKALEPGRKPMEHAA
jgi:hypothetical protein